VDVEGGDEKDELAADVKREECEGDWLKLGWQNVAAPLKSRLTTLRRYRNMTIIITIIIIDSKERMMHIEIRD